VTFVQLRKLYRNFKVYFFAILDYFLFLLACGAVNCCRFKYQPDRAQYELKKTDKLMIANNQSAFKSILKQPAELACKTSSSSKRLGRKAVAENKF